MINAEALRKDLQGRVKLLEKDLVEQVGTSGPLYSGLRAEYDAAFRLKRTAATWAVWRDERITQAAVAWILGTVFVRFCEDNGLFGDACFLAGPTKQRAILAEESQEEHFRIKPADNDRHWLLTAFDHIGRTQAGKTLFDPKHNAAYQLPISPDAAKELIAFWRRTNADGVLIHDFTDPDWGTRFLGDLYQNLSEATRKTYALLQTPDFVEEFILDLTLTPAIEEFGLDVVKMIDPACGSGHFVLGAFHRLVKQWRETTRREPHEIVRLALEAVHGVDINPFAVAIARFRLLIAAVKEANFKTFGEFADISFSLNLAIGDSLIRDRQLNLFSANGAEIFGAGFSIEDIDNYPDIVREGRYHAVVGNPPYITPKDKSLNELYRRSYPDVCSGAYALSVPFVQRLFELARAAGPDGRFAGFVGQITANSFMKREFGRRLIEGYFARAVDLTYVIDTSGAYIPGHGTPTVILVGRRREARLGADTIRVALGVRGEPREPKNPAEGFVWRAITENLLGPPVEDEWVSVSDALREGFNRFPWNLSGGGSRELQSRIEHAGVTSLVAKAEVGTGAVTRDNEAFIVGRGALVRANVLREFQRPVLEGENVRDWGFVGDSYALWPYSNETLSTVEDVSVTRFLWRFRTQLSIRSAFGKSQLERGLKWFEYSMFFRDRFGGSTIAFPFVATHSSFCLDRDGRVFNRTAPVVKVRDSCPEEEPFLLLGVLNSSTACFWLKQVSHDKGSQSGTGGFMHDEWERFYEFTGTKLQEFPLPSAYPLGLATELDGSARRLTALSPAEVAKEAVPTRERLAEAKDGWHATRGRMIALQEELDWEVYQLYGLLDDALTCVDVPEIKLGERAFEIVLARRMARGETETQWFARHGSTPITEIPGHWPAAYREIVEKRIRVIETNRYLALIERPECKRRWATEGWDRMQERALRDWLLDRCERRELWFEPDEYGFEQPRPLSTAELADELQQHDPDFVSVAELYAPGTELDKVVADLVEPEHVPYLAALRYKDSGLDKRNDWEHVWDLQRQEDAAEDEEAKQRIRTTIPVPPKYAQADFRKPSYWSNRGKLDVPKERFISYPLAERDGGTARLIGWAGWDHLEQAHVLSMLIVDRADRDGWAAERLVPLLAGLREVLPWARQWHYEVEPEAVDEYQGLLGERLTRWNLTVDDLTGWRPPAAVRGKRSVRG